MSEATVEAKKFTISRSKWLRGDSNDSYLYRTNDQKNIELEFVD